MNMGLKGNRYYMVLSIGRYTCTRAEGEISTGYKVNL